MGTRRLIEVLTSGTCRLVLNCVFLHVFGTGVFFRIGQRFKLKSNVNDVFFFEILLKLEVEAILSSPLSDISEGISDVTALELAPNFH